MWTSTLLLACLASLAAAHTLPQEADRYFEASKDFAKKQLQVLKMFVWQYDTEMYEDFSDIVKQYKLEDHIGDYKNADAVRKFLSVHRAGRLFPKTKQYTLFESWPREEAILLFEMFIYAKDFDTLIKTAVYTRELVHRGLFYYAFRTALGVREDTRDFYYPPSYETYPYSFLDERVMQKALDAKIKALQTGDYRPVVIPANYSDYKDAGRDPENVLSYFREDVGLLMMNVDFHRRFPAWLNSSRYGERHDRKGELFLHYQRQLLARHYLERLGHNLGDVPYIRADTLLGGYFPRLRHNTGEQVTPRQPFTKIRDTRRVTLTELEEYIMRIRDAIKRGYVMAENGTRVPLQGEKGLDILGETLGFVGDNINYKYYSSIYNKDLYVLGGGDEEKVPSSLLHAETALRDPLYYQYMDTFFRDYYYEYMKTLPRYTYDDVAFPGMTIDNVDVDKLITYFEDYDIDLFSATGKGFRIEDNKLEVLARVKRLNRRPFSYRVSLTSDKAADVIVKVFITPKFDPQGRVLPVNKRVLYAFEIDRFPAKVNLGKNVIQRKCHESTVAVGDPPTFKQMWKQAYDVINGTGAAILDAYSRPYGFPHRLLLPKGTRSGLPVQFVVAVFPYQEAAPTDSVAYDLRSVTLLGTTYGVKYPDPRPIAFPTDRFFRSEHDASVPNIFTKEVRIFQKTLEELGEAS